jgi:hypothetical protein
MKRESPHSRLDRGGFSVIELLVYLIIAIVVVTGIYQVLIGQNRLYLKQRELQDVRTSLRAAANLLAFELRQLSAADSDLYVINTFDLKLRSVQGTGIVCAIHGTQPRFGLYATSGAIEATTDDSVLVFAAGAAGTGDDGWVQSGIDRIYTPAAGGVPDCAWTTVSANPDLVVEVDTTTAWLSGVQVGAPFREFRTVQYGSYDEGGSGLVFVYYDVSGNVTADLTQVKMVDIILRGESFGKAPQAGNLGPQVQEDSLTLRVSLRG